MYPDDNTENTNTSAISTNNNYPKKTYTVDEIAVFLKISKSKAYEICKQDCFKVIKIGRAVRIVKLSFDKWFDAQ